MGWPSRSIKSIRLAIKTTKTHDPAPSQSKNGSVWPDSRNHNAANATPKLNECNKSPSALFRYLTKFHFKTNCHLLLIVSFFGGRFLVCPAYSAENLK
jgi:hypothetical protein